jgi:hypothetical protein
MYSITTCRVLSMGADTPRAHRSTVPMETRTVSAMSPLVTVPSPRKATILAWNASRVRGDVPSVMKYLSASELALGGGLCYFFGAASAILLSSMRSQGTIALAASVLGA